MFLLPERNVPIPLSHDEVCKRGGWGGAAVRPCPSHHLGGGMERRGQPEGGGGRKVDCHTHIQLLGDAEGWGGGRCYLSAAEIKQFAALSGCSPSYCPRSGEP